MGITSELGETGALGPITSTATDGIMTGFGVQLKILNVDPIVVGDDGGWKLTLTGAFPLVPEYIVEILRQGETFNPQRCFSGVVGQGDRCRSTNIATLTCYVPPLPIGSGYDIRVTSTDGALTDTALDKLQVIHRSFTSNVYSLRAHWPPPRAVGARSLDEED